MYCFIHNNKLSIKRSDIIYYEELLTTKKYISKYKTSKNIFYKNSYYFNYLIYGFFKKNFFFINSVINKKKIDQDLFKTVNNYSSTINSTFFFKRNQRYNITGKKKNIFASITFRKYLTRNLNVLNFNSRWLIQTFFFFRVIYFYMNSIKSLNIIFFFKNITSFFFYNIKTFFDNFNFFFKNNKKNFIFYFFRNFFFFNIKVFKKIKSLKKFKQKIFLKKNNSYFFNLLHGF